LVALPFAAFDGAFFFVCFVAFVAFEPDGRRSSGPLAGRFVLVATSAPARDRWEHRDLVVVADRGIRRRGVAVQPHARAVEQPGELGSELHACRVEHLADRRSADGGAAGARGFPDRGKEAELGHVAFSLAEEAAGATTLRALRVRGWLGAK
jgi:hypothetical protein